MNALDAAVFDALTAASALTDLLTDGADSVFQHVGPENTDPPYVVYAKQSNVPASTFAEPVAYENALYMVKAVTVSPGANPDASAAGTIAAAIDTVLQDAALTIDGHTHMLCRRFSDIDFVELDPGGQVIAHRGGVYRLQADPA